MSELESERVRKEVEWTGERAEVDIEKTGYINYYVRSRPRPLHYYLVSINYWLLTIN